MKPLACLAEQRRKHKQQWEELVRMADNENEDGDYDAILWAADELMRKDWTIKELIKLTRDFIKNPKYSYRDTLTDFMDELEDKPCPT